MFKRKRVVAQNHEIALPGMTLFCRVLGQGQPIVFLHGYNQSNRLYEKIEQELAHDFQLILLDSRGHGNSSLNSQVVSIALLAKDVVRVLDYLDIQQCFIIGYSDGGNIALQLAISYPQRLKAIIAISSNYSPAGLKKSIFTSLTLWRLGLKIAAKLHLGWAQKHLQLSRLLLEQPQIQIEELTNIHTPALLIWAERDFIQEGHIAEITASIPHNQSMRIPQTTHLSVIRKWSMYKNSVVEFLTKYSHSYIGKSKRDLG